MLVQQKIKQRWTLYRSRSGNIKPAFCLPNFPAIEGGNCFDVLFSNKKRRKKETRSKEKDRRTKEQEERTKERRQEQNNVKIEKQA